MNRFVFALGLAACARASTAEVARPQPATSQPIASSAPSRQSRGSGPNGCFTREELAARTAQARSDSEAAFVDAVQRMGLRPITLQSHTLARGIEPGPIRPAHVEDRALGTNPRVRLIVMPPTGGCGDLSKAFEFAAGSGQVWLVERRVTANRISVALCGCPTCTCDVPQASPCGGVRIAADTILGYELPAGMQFSGKREIAYAEDWIAVDQALPPQPVCIPRPPPP